MQAFINELSFPILPSIDEAVHLFSALSNCYKDCRIMGVKELKVHSTFYNHQFAPGYSFLHWIADRAVDEDLRGLLKSAVGTVPFVDEILVGYEDENGVVLKMEQSNNSCIGLGLASDIVFNTLSLSYDATIWSSNQYPVSITVAEEDQDGHLVEQTYAGTARNVSSGIHADFHRKFINASVRKTIPNGTELWLRKEDLFPNLKFCDLVKEQISSMNANTLGFQIIIERLYDLQNVAINCTGIGVNPANFPTFTTPESDSRLKEFKDVLTIRCPDGVSRLFSWHSRFTPGAGRIHFIPYEAEKLFLVGSIANQNRVK